MILGGPHQHLWGSFTVVCRETPFWVTVLQGTLSGSSPDLVAKIQREQKPPRQTVAPQQNTLLWPERQEDKSELGTDNENASGTHRDFMPHMPLNFLSWPLTFLHT